jgi:uncharacterized coiled-coil protein SlyX
MQAISREAESKTDLRLRKARKLVREYGDALVENQRTIAQLRDEMDRLHRTIERLGDQA